LPHTPNIFFHKPLDKLLRGAYNPFMKRKHLFLVSDEEFQGFQEGKSFRFVSGEDEYEIRRETPSRVWTRRIPHNVWKEVETYLSAHPRIKVAALAEATGVHKSTVSSFLYRFKKKGATKQNKAKEWSLV